MTPPMARRVAMGCAVLGAVMFGVLGAWSSFAPRSFYDLIATYPPYNLHLFHDLGVFQLGIAASLAAGIVGRSPLAVGLWGGAVAAVGHAISHWADADRGGRSTDPLMLSLVAIVVLGGLIVVELGARRTTHAGEHRP